MVGIGGMNAQRIDRTRCGICWHLFEEQEPKVQRPDEKFYRCMGCDKLGKKPKMHPGNMRNDVEDDHRTRD